MGLQQTLRTALVATALLAAAIAGNAHQLPNEVRQLVQAPIAQHVSSSPNLAKLASSLLSNNHGKSDIEAIAQNFLMTPDAASVSVARTVAMIQLHLSPNEQKTALQSILESSFGNKHAARALSKSLPENNVVADILRQTYESQELLGTGAGWQEFSMAAWSAPRFNVQQTLAEPGVKALQSILKNTCAIPETSIAVQESSYSCAMRDGTRFSQEVAKNFRSSYMSDGLLVGEYEGVPVLVLHGELPSQGPAAVYRLRSAEEGKTGTPFIAVSLGMLQVLDKNPDTLAFIMEHELGHVEHKHVMTGNDHDEIEADSAAVASMRKKGMSPERIAKAYSDFETKFSSLFPSPVLQNATFVQMMDARHKNIANQVRSPQYTSASIGLPGFGMQ